MDENKKQQSTATQGNQQHAQGGSVQYASDRHPCNALDEKDMRSVFTNATKQVRLINHIHVKMPVFKLQNTLRRVARRIFGKFGVLSIFPVKDQIEAVARKAHAFFMTPVQPSKLMAVVDWPKKMFALHVSHPKRLRNPSLRTIRRLRKFLSSMGFEPTYLMIPPNNPVRGVTNYINFSLFPD
jgi:hypothetical protein